MTAAPTLADNAEQHFAVLNADLTPVRLTRLIARKLASLRKLESTASAADYEEVIERVAKRVPKLQEELARNQDRAKRFYANLVDEPAGRRATVLENGQPAMLFAMAHDLVARSFAHRFGDPARSLKLASLALEVANRVAESEYLSEATAADLLGEVWDYVGNARRLNSDMIGAELAFSKAEHFLDIGTRDRTLRATHLSMLGSHRYGQGRAREASEIFEHEIRLRRLLKQPNRLASALLNRGIVACGSGEPLTSAHKFIREGVELTQEDRVMYLALMAFAEALARQSEGVQAWKVLCMCHLVGGLGDFEPSLRRRHHWVEGVTQRALGDFEQAESSLRMAKDEFEQVDLPLIAGFVSLDLLTVYAAQKRFEEMTQLAREAYEIFKAARLEEPALSAFMVLYKAARLRTLSEQLAVRVTNFILRYQIDRSARFEIPERS